VLFHDRSDGAAFERLRLAVEGLALRGHDVRAATSARAPGSGAGRDVEIVVGAGASPRRVALAGRVAGARCMVLGLVADELDRWSVLDRWACQSAYTLGLLDAAEGDAVRARPHGIPLERLALWGDDPPPTAPEAAHPDTEILERACERSLARSRGRGRRAAVFVDRDGTLVVERGYLSDPRDIELLPGALRAISTLNAAGFPVVVISNQSGVGRGLFPLSRVHDAMARMRGALRAGGVELDAVYFCPHRPEAGCSCRKPGTGLLERAADDLQLDLARSAMVGDKLIDAETARRAGALGILVRTGYGKDEEQRLAAEAEPPPDAICEDLEEAAAFILARREPRED
jgi:D-glycero-D-manno-heptose 1,7-bisphosphate phosphatase